MDFLLSKQPFSRYGAMLAIKEYREGDAKRPADLPPGYYLYSVHGFHSKRELFRIELQTNGEGVPFNVHIHSSHLEFVAEEGVAKICISDPDTIRFQSEGVTLQLTSPKNNYTYVIEHEADLFTLNIASSFLIHQLHRVDGDVVVEKSGSERPGGHITISVDGEICITQHVGFASPAEIDETFEQACHRVESAFRTFSSPYERESGDYRVLCEQATFLNWSCVVAPRGNFKRPAMLMSKNWMTNVWSWDHAINALALAPYHPELAWDQLLTMFDHQLPTGQLPDFVNDTCILRNYVKPPIHGWILSRMRQENDWFNDDSRLSAFYESLKQWTEWWYQFRSNDSGLFDYYHGNDSGWDNGTVFDMGVPSTSPDIAAFLILQLEELAKIAKQIGLDQEGDEWLLKADQLLERLIDQLWDGERFRTVNKDSKYALDSDSVFSCRPIILGKRLPGEIRQKLVKQIRHHLTEWGLATEHPESPLYETHGYWRGPIWAPPSLIITEGLIEAGETELAIDIARRFCRLCQHAGAFAENFDALTGEPLCDPAYTWTASVFLILMRKRVRRGIE